MRIEIISGSPRKASVTHRVALHLEKRLKESTSHDVTIIALKEVTIPFVQATWKSPTDAPAELQPYAQRMFDADAFILLTPEYNGGYSPALKNFLDHFPKHIHKPFGVVTASDGALGGMRAAQQLLLLVSGIFGIVSPQMLIVPTMHTKFDEEGNLIDEKFEKSIKTFLTEYLWLAEKLSG